MSETATKTQVVPHIHPPNALSNSLSGDCYTGLGCFPIGHNNSLTETNELVSKLHTLRTSKMLHRVSTLNYDNLKANLAPLQQAQTFWAHHKRDEPQAHAVHELLGLLEKRSSSLQIYTFPDSSLLSASAPTIWGLSEISIQDGITYLYISAKSPDFASAVLHTFLSSRKISRMQCFLAEYVLADQEERLEGEWELPVRLQADVELLTMEELKELAGRLDSEGRLEAPVLLAKLAGLCEELIEKTKEPVWADEERGGIQIM